jgi:hypothetical protein
MLAWDAPKRYHIRMADKTLIAKLSEILAQLYEIRLSIKENQGQGFLVNAESNIKTFINFQAALPRVPALIDTKSLGD